MYQMKLEFHFNSKANNRNVLNLQQRSSRNNPENMFHQQSSKRVQSGDAPHKLQHSVELLQAIHKICNAKNGIFSLSPHRHNAPISQINTPLKEDIMVLLTTPLNSTSIAAESQLLLNFFVFVKKMHRSKNEQRKQK